MIEITSNYSIKNYSWEGDRGVLVTNVVFWPNFFSPIKHLLYLVIIPHN